MATGLSRTKTKSATDKIERQSPYIRAVTAKAIAEDSIAKIDLMIAEEPSPSYTLTPHC